MKKEPNDTEVHWLAARCFAGIFRALEPMNHSISDLLLDPAWTIEGKGLTPYLFPAYTGVPSPDPTTSA
jgi:hypothetical protein